MKPSLIVCAVEFSASGKAALGRALALARWYEAELHVLYVQPGRVRRATSSTASTGDSVHGRLEEFVRSLKAEGVNITPVVVAGDPAKIVAEYARLNAADLLVVGQHGRRGSRFWPPGVLATDLARAVQCATLTIPSELVADSNIDPSFGNVVCGIDFSSASRHALDKALTLAQESGGRVTLLHVIEGFPYESVYSGSRAFRVISDYRARAEKIKRELHALVPPEALNWCEIETEVVSGVPHGAMLAAATTRRADLLVIGLSQRTRLERIVMASTVAGVLRRLRCPVLTVPGPSSVTETGSQPTVRREEDGPIAGAALPTMRSLAATRRPNAVQGSHGDGCSAEHRNAIGDDSRADRRNSFGDRGREVCHGRLSTGQAWDIKRTQQVGTLDEHVITI